MSSMWSTILGRCVGGSGGRSVTVVVGRISSSTPHSAAVVTSSSAVTVHSGSTFHFRRDFSVSSRTTSVAAERSYKLLVLGGGTAGCAIASKFSSTLGKGQVAVVEPSETHYYQAMFTLVGAGLRTLEETHRPMQAVLPREVDWIRDSVVSFEPDKNTVTTGNGNVLKYDFLVVALGLQLNYDQIKNAVEALNEDPTVVSIYSSKYVQSVCKALDSTKSGNAIFTFPQTAVKCAGAAQKICYLAEEKFRRNGVRSDVNVLYNTAPPTIFSSPYYATALEKLAVSRGIQWNKLRNLVEIRHDKKEAVFDIMENGKATGKTEVFKYSLLHVAPPMSSPRALWNSQLVDGTNFVAVDQKTLQHVKFKNVYALGDCANTPTSKTAAACASQIGIVGNNLALTMDGKDPTKQYNGYTSCPLVVNHNKVLLAEFGYDGRVLETFPFDQRVPRRSMFLLKNYMMPWIYWKLMVRGLWHGPGFFRRMWRFGS